MLKPELECAIGSMVHSTRSALGMASQDLSAIMKGGASVSLFVESFGILDRWRGHNVAFVEKYLMYTEKLSHLINCIIRKERVC